MTYIKGHLNNKLMRNIAYSNTGSQEAEIKFSGAEEPACLPSIGIKQPSDAAI